MGFWGSPCFSGWLSIQRDRRHLGRGGSDAYEPPEVTIILTMEPKPGGKLPPTFCTKWEYRGRDQLAKYIRLFIVVARHIGGTSQGSVNSNGGMKEHIAMARSDEPLVLVLPSNRCRPVARYVQASTKYLHQRLLVVLVSPPLPGIMTQQRHPTRHNASKRRGSSGEDGSESDGSVDEQGGGTYETSSIGSALSSTSSGSEGDYCSDDDAGRESYLVS